MASGTANDALMRVGQLERWAFHQAKRSEKLESRMEGLEKSRDEWRKEAMALRDLVKSNQLERAGV